MKMVICANEECSVIFRQPLVYEKLSSFCPVCREWIEEQVNIALRVFDEATDGPTQ